MAGDLEADAERGGERCGVVRGLVVVRAERDGCGGEERVG